MSLEIQVEAVGFEALDSFLEQFGPKALEAAVGALRADGEAIMLDSKENYVPVDQGTLSGSGYVEEPVVEGEHVSVRLAFGGPASAYAIAIHEHLSNYSPPSWKKAEASGSGVHFRQGGPKYLELPFLAHLRGMADRIADAIRSKLGA